MDEAKKINSFKSKLIDPLLFEITQILNITSNRQGEENHGVQLMSMICLLVAIETVSQFIVESPDDIEGFMVSAKSCFDSLPSEQKRYLAPKTIPDNPNGQHQAITFMEKFFTPVFGQTTEIKQNESLAKLIWKFRNAQAHTFYPFVNRSRSLRGRVNWMYRGNSNDRIGMSIDEIEELNNSVPQLIYGIVEVDGVQWFAVNVQILFIHFKKGVNNFITELSENEDQLNIFLGNYNRLKDIYMFN